MNINFLHNNMGNIPLVQIYIIFLIEQKSSYF